MNIKDKVIAITGAAQGLGLETALYLAERGANIALIDLDQTALDSAREACEKVIGGAGATAKTYVANVANESAVIEAFTNIKSDFGTLHGLINNAGITRDALLVKVKNGSVDARMSLQQWQSVIDVNLTGVFLCGREAATIMIDTKSEGVVVNISSISKAGNIGQSNYSATKAAVESLSVTWAKELARYSIRSAVIAPGVMETEMVASMKPEAREMITRQIPLNRLGQPLHIAKTVAFILENDYVSGRTIEVDAAFRV